MYYSPFKPKSIKDYCPKNTKIYTFHAGFKQKAKDLLIVVFDKPVPVASVYSKTSTPSAPIIWDKKNNKGICKVLIINSGNANAHTGNQGLKNIDQYVNQASKYFKCKKNQILVSSTGVIGEQLNPKKIYDKFVNFKSNNSKGILDAAKAIMTTDTFPKTAISKINYKSQDIIIYGFAKGSGMIAPNMGTMLAYIFINIYINNKKLKSLLNKHLENSFNSISVDGDTSTNDTVMFFSTGLKSKKINIEKNFLNKISLGVESVMKKLSKQIISDGEGISKLIEVDVINAKNKEQAKSVAFSVGESLLVKTAIAGADANWGRIVMAIGKADKNIIQNKMIIKFGNLTVSKNGLMYKKINLSKLNHYMRNKTIKIKIDLGLGRFSRKIWSSDLTYHYLKINSDYRS